MTDPLAATIEGFLRSIPERWTDFVHDDLSVTEQKALFLLVAAGLVERRIGIRGEFAGQSLTIEFTIDATGEYGFVEAMKPVVAEVWSKWGSAIEEWHASEARGSVPFRFIKTGLDRWRLTDHGVMARADLDIDAPSPEAAKVIGSFQRAIEFVTRTGHQIDRPSVRGEGRLVVIKVNDCIVQPTPMPVTLVNSNEVASSFQEMVFSAVKEAIRPSTSGDTSQGASENLKSGEPQVKWITVTEAATSLLEEVSGISLKKARARVSRAAGKHRFRTNGKRGLKRRIDLDSFNTWRLEQRDMQLDEYDRKYS